MKENLLFATCACTSFLIAFIGMIHEIEGAALFPWAPEMFGSTLWHGLGATSILLGGLSLSSVVGYTRLPVMVFGMISIIVGTIGVVVVALKTGQFHFLAFSSALSGLILAIYYPKLASLQERLNV